MYHYVKLYLEIYFMNLVLLTALGVGSATVFGALLGFVTFKLDLVNAVLGADTLPNLYICTLLLSPAARGKGVTAKMYAHLFDSLYPSVNLFTRTWSTNAAHLKILDRFGFSLIKRIENDRGEGIDTVYFGKMR